MREYIITILIVVVGVFALLILSMTIENNSLKRELLQSQIQSVGTEVGFAGCKSTLNEFSAFNRAIEKIGTIPYNSDGANCYDQSKLMTAAFAEEGIKSSIIIKGDRSHSWVAVWIEATSGRFVPIGEEEILELRSGVDPAKVEVYNNAL